MNVILIFPVLFALLLSLAAEVLLGVWTYRDARARGLNAALWTVVVLLVPSFVGLIVYLVAGRNQANGLCPGCSAAIQPNVKFCPHCGAAVGPAGNGAEGAAPAPKPIPRTGRGLLIAAVCCIALMVLGIFSVGMLGVMRYKSNYIPNSNISIGSVENHSSQNWSMSFYSLDGEKTCDQLQYDGEKPASVHVKASLGSGKMSLVLTQGDTRMAVDLSSSTYISDIGLIEFQPGTIHMALVAEDAKDGSVDVSWYPVAAEGP